ncbi:MAG TPA: LysM peptidoglycan-binding domain-containing protein [Pyrinomonadaceae bacterium]|nr:LysM peptidoglycan-binding domain-containing protein [Pyrinomonadaceae bacterium]
MKFSSDSIKLRSKAQNEDFCFDLETPRGHFFAVLDFGSHDYANLNATLKGKLETIVGSFVSLSRFSAELFLGFLAKEINNFLHNLGEQSGGPDLLASGALCLVNGNRLTYFLCGDLQLNVINNGRLLPLFGPAAGDSGATTDANAGIERLGARNQEAPLTDVVQSFTLQDADLVLLMTRGLHEVFAGRKLADEIAAVGSTDPKVICEALMKSGASAREDRSLVVMGGPYEKYVDPVFADLSKAVAALESRMEALSEDQSGSSNQGPADQRIAQQLEVLRDDLRGKAAKIDLLELDERVKGLSDRLSKENIADVTTETRSVGSEAGAENRRTRIPIMIIALLVLGAALVGSFVGAWMQSRVMKKSAEVWSVKTAGNQITISRLDAEPATVTLNVAQPVNATGEQRFSSFADAKRYIDTIAQNNSGASPATAVTPTAENKPAEAVTEITVKPGDSLKKLAQQYNVPPEKIMSLNPTITRWPTVRIGQRIIVPASPTPPLPLMASPVSSPSNQPSPAGSPPKTTEITVVPGDSLNRLATKYNATPDRLRELNPQVTNWATILPGQKIVVPALPTG